MVLRSVVKISYTFLEQSLYVTPFFLEKVFPSNPKSKSPDSSEGFFFFPILPITIYSSHNFWESIPSRGSKSV